MRDVLYGWLLVAHRYARGLRRAFAQAADGFGEGPSVACGTAQRPRGGTSQSVSTSSTGRPRPLIGGSGSAGHTRQRPAA